MSKATFLRAGLVTFSAWLMLVGAVTELSAQTTPPPLTIRYVDRILEEGDLRLASELVSAQAVLSTPEGEFFGPAGVTSFSAELTGAFSNLDFRVDSTHLDDDSLLIDFTLTGVQSGPYQGIPGRCAIIEVPGTALLELDGGMINDQQIDYDRAEIVRQAHRFNQLASYEGITCDQQLVDELAPPQDDAEVIGSQTSTGDTCTRNSPCPMP